MFRTTPAARGARPLEALEDPVEHDPVPRQDLPGEVLRQKDRHALRVGSEAERFGMLLDLDPLGVHVGRFLGDEPEAGPALGLAAASLRFRAFEGFAEDERGLVLPFVELRPARNALEDGVPDLGPDLGDPTHDPVEPDEMVEVGLPDRPHRPMRGRGKAHDADPKLLGLGSGHRQELLHRADARSDDLLGPFEEQVRERRIGAVHDRERDLERPLLGEPVVKVQDPGTESGFLEHGRPPALELGRRGEGPLGSDHRMHLRYGSRR